MKEITKKRIGTVIKYIVMTVAVFAVALALHCFNFPNDFALGGVSGLAILLSQFLPLSPADFVSIANIVLLILGFIVIGRSFGIKTVYCTTLLSVLLELMERFFPVTSSLTGERLLDLLFAVFLSAAGQAVLFNLGGSSGGTDIIGMIIKKFLRIDIGKAILCVDILIVAGTFWIFGVETGLYSVLGTLVTMMVIDTSISTLNLSKYFLIVTTKPDEVQSFITSMLDRGATRWDAYGAYTGEKKTMILVVMNRYQARKLRDNIKKIDPDSFILVSDTSDIIGNGFKTIK